MSRTVHDAVIVGGGPAGLAAALWLARYRRAAVVLDVGSPRNQPAWGVHGFPGIVDPDPLALRRRMREQAVNAGATHREGEAVALDGEKDGFTLVLADDDRLHCRRVVLAYGLRDFLPAIAGIEAFYGNSVFHCADCDGPTVYDRDVAVLGTDAATARLALYLLHFTPRVTLLTDGRTPLRDALGDELFEHGVLTRTEPIAGVDGAGGQLRHVCFEDDTRVACDALFFHLGSEPRCDLAGQQDCDATEDGYIHVDRGQETSVPGIYAAGDITGYPHLASIAAAEGVRAALAIHRSLLPEARRLDGVRG